MESQLLVGCEEVASLQFGHRNGQHGEEDNTVEIHFASVALANECELPMETALT